MDDRDTTDFYVGLNEMGAMCCDELTEVRQRLYWEFFRDGHTLEEWLYACNQVMWRETYHKVPMPAILREYIVEFRKATAEERKQREQRTRVPLERQIRDDEVSLEELRALQASLWPEERARLDKDPIPPYTPEDH